MKKQNLGKIILLIVFMAVTLVAGDVSAKVDKSAIYRGDRVNLTISAQGSDVTFPQIQKIGGFDIIGTSSAQNTTIINGDISHTKSKIYTFVPTHSVEIPPFSIEVDGKTYKTKKLKVKVLKPTQATNGAPFILQMNVDKKSVFVGEPIRLDINFKQKLNAHADKIQISPPNVENFWVKEIKGSKQSTKGDYRVQTYSYLLFPQKEGNYTIPAIEGAIGVRVKSQSGFGGDFFDDPFFQSMMTSLQWKKLFSNDVKVSVKALPNDLEVSGHFKIEAKVDKTKVTANKPVNLSIHIYGEGNVDDIKKFDIDIPDAVVYADEPKITSGLNSGTYVGDFRQKVAIIADRNYTIPAISFNYFDIKKRKKVTIETKPIDIFVNGSNALQINQPKIQKSQAIKNQANPSSIQTPKTVIKKVEVPSHTRYLYLLAGFLMGAGIVFVWFTYKDKLTKKEQKPIVKRILKAKGDKALYDLLLPYSKKGEYIAKVLQRLEENIYANKNHSIDKREIADYFEEVLSEEV